MVLLKEIINKVELIKSTEIFSVLSDDECDFLITEFSNTVKFKKGETVFSHGSKNQFVGIILKGEVLVKKEHILINRLGASEIFGAITLYNKENGFVNDIVAKTDCTVLFIYKEGVEYLINNIPQFSKKYIEYLSERIFFLNSKIKAYTTPSAQDKLYNYLVKNSDDGKVRLSGKMTELANSLNLSRASLYRAFDELEDDGRIIKTGKNIILL